MSQPGYAEFRHGWPIVLASMLGIGLGLSPLPFYTIGVFAPYFRHDFGWTMGQIMGGVTITTLMVLWAGPLVGVLATRWPVRRIAIGSLILFGLAFMALGLSSGSLLQYDATFAAIAILGAGTLPMTWTVLINHRFNVRKGLAIGIALAGTGLFGVFSKGLTTWLIAQFGWRGAYVGLGLLPILVAAPVAIALFHDEPRPAEAARVFHDTPGPAESLARATVHPGMNLTQALKDRRFWTMAFGFLIVSLALAGPVPNMENILKTAGITATTILKLTPLIGLSALSGRLIGGWFVDRFWAPAVAFVILSLPAIACWLLATVTISFGIAALSILLIGFALGVEYDLMAFFIARYFGLRSYSAIYGVLYVFFSLGAGFGPLAFGMDFDRHGSYRLALITAVVVLLGAALSFLTLGRYRDFEDEVPAAPPGNLAAA